MKTRVTKTGLNIPPEFLGGLDEVEIRKEHNRVVIVPVTVPVADPLRKLGVTPIDEAISDASVNHDAYLNGK